jgi:hypothetical protein
VRARVQYMTDEEKLPTRCDISTSHSHDTYLLHDQLSHSSFIVPNEHRVSTEKEANLPTTRDSFNQTHTDIEPLNGANQSDALNTLDAVS